MSVNQPDEMPNHLLDQAIVSLKARANVTEKASPVPTAHTISQTLARLHAAERDGVPPASIWRSILSAPVFRLSTAAAIVISLAGLFWFIASRSGTVAFADVIANVKDIRSVIFTITGRTRVPGEAPVTLNSNVTVCETGIRKIDEAGGMISICNIAARKIIQLDPKGKTATILDLSTQAAEGGALNVLEQFKRLESIGYEQVAGESTIENHVVVEFDAKPQTANAIYDPSRWQQIWVDKQTQLPVRIATQVGETSLVIHDFKWNVPIDEASFSITPPAGYAVQSAPDVDSPPVTESDFLAALRTMAALNNNTLPNRPDFTTAAHLVGAAFTKLVRMKKDSPEAIALRQQLTPDLLSKLTGALMFTGSPANGSDFHYAGKGVAVGRANTPILWYQPKGSAKYIVIDADFSRHEVNANELPAVESVRLGSPM